MLKFYDQFSATAPDELGVLAALATLPDGTKAVVHPICYSGPVDRGEQVLRPLRTFTIPLADQIQAMPYTALQSIVENFNPRGFRNYWKAVYLKELSEDAIATMTEWYARVPAPHTHVVVYTMGGALSRVPADQTAVAYRDARHALIVIGMWENPAEDETNIQWGPRISCCRAALRIRGLLSKLRGSRRSRSPGCGVWTGEVSPLIGGQAQVRSEEYLLYESEYPAGCGLIAKPD